MDIINFFGHYDISALNVVGDINVTSTINGKTYIITSVGTTNFTTIGASSNDVGTVFTATGVGTGTGKVNQAVPFKVNNALTWEEQ